MKIQYTKNWSMIQINKTQHVKTIKWTKARHQDCKYSKHIKLK